MQKKLTITIDEKVYLGLRKRIGPGQISHFIEDLVRPHVVSQEFESAYAEMAKEEAREEEAMEFIEAVIGDVCDEPR